MGESKQWLTESRALFTVAIEYCKKLPLQLQHQTVNTVCLRQYRAVPLHQPLPTVKVAILPLHLFCSTDHSQHSKEKKNMLYTFVSKISKKRLNIINLPFLLLLFLLLTYFIPIHIHTYLVRIVTEHLNWNFGSVSFILPLLPSTPTPTSTPTSTFTSTSKRWYQPWNPHQT